MFLLESFSLYHLKIFIININTMACIKVILNFQNELRLHHWGTQSYPAHQALGMAYESIDDLLDTFTETYIGVYGRNEIYAIKEMRFNGPDNISPEKVLDSFEEYLINGITKEIDDKETALLNIRDEILGTVQKTKYLLTLK
jgi:hypothetical protein